MMISIIFKIISLKLSKKSLTGFDLSSGNKIIAIPKITAKKITCNIFPLSAEALIILSGTISINDCNGPTSLCLFAASIFELASAV